ncbi:Hypothetical predicted protein [Cloeon dipterum]|uniref:Uncharacterized protein n=1 Tax=Cloeon dipterum TaxID=197152 RepID=A0A8S1BUG6_9INSE|nr:Hypothetical predicted protein [Cloeon dipterum]
MTLCVAALPAAAATTTEPALCVLRFSKAVYATDRGKDAAASAADALDLRAALPKASRLVQTQTPQQPPGSADWPEKREPLRRSARRGAAERARAIRHRRGIDQQPSVDHSPNNHALSARESNATTHRRTQAHDDFDLNFENPTLC